MLVRLLGQTSFVGLADFPLPVLYVCVRPRIASLQLWMERDLCCTSQTRHNPPQQSSTAARTGHKPPCCSSSRWELGSPPQKSPLPSSRSFAGRNGDGSIPAPGGGDGDRGDGCHPVPAGISGSCDWRPGDRGGDLSAGSAIGQAWFSTSRLVRNWQVWGCSSLGIHPAASLDHPFRASPIASMKTRF
jgi:hypothetical protein